MPYVLAAFLLCLHILMWGAGLAMLVVPWRWRKCWPALSAPAGVALQSAVVWIGAHTDWPGTDSYAWWSLVLPLGLLGLGMRRMRWVNMKSAVRRWWAVGAIMAVCLTVLTLPLEWASNTLTATSLGSCDAADYAAGARVFKEFASSDRSGFLGLTEVVSVGSTDNFFDFWLKLNHFTPSALMALNGSIFGWEPHEIVNVLTVVLLVLVMPVVYLLARAAPGMKTGAALWLSFLYGISPLNWYAAYHVAPAQIIAAQGIALVTWAALLLWREGNGTNADWRYAGVLCIAFALLWGAYNFIIIVCLVPAVACVGGWAAADRKVPGFLKWLRRLIVPLGLAGLFYYDRVAGLAERFLLFEATDFGWKVPPLMPEGWVGLVADTGLREWRGWWAPLLSALVVVPWVITWFRSMLNRGAEAWRVFAYLAPVMTGYAYLQWRGWSSGSNASYDAYKLFAVFYPVLLTGFCAWLVWLGAGRLWRWWALGLMGLITLGNGYASARFAQRMSQGVLQVGPDLVQLQKIEAMPEVASVNLRMRELWERLWTNNFLLRKEQYFQTHSYEGRLDTNLRGEWDLTAGLVQLELPEGDSIRLNERFTLTKVSSPWRLQAAWGPGWYGPERLKARRPVHWNWSGSVGELRINNPHQQSRQIRLHLKLRSLRDRDVQIWLNGVYKQSVEVGHQAGEVIAQRMAIPSGDNMVSLSSTFPPMRGGKHDRRELGVAVYGVVVEVLTSDTDCIADAPSH